MNQPIVGDNRAKLCCRKIVSFCESWFVKQIARPIVFLLPPILLTSVAYRAGLKEDVVKWFGAGVGDLLNQSAFLIIVGAYIYVVIMKAIYAAINSYAKPSRELGTGDLIAILKAMNIVVNEKAKRMADKAKSALQQKNICPKRTFLQITQPGQQLYLLIAGIKSVFEYIDQEKAEYRVGLLKISGNKAVEWIAFEPYVQPPRTTPEDLNAPTSTVTHCIKTKSIVVVDDIQKELKKPTKDERRFLRSNTQIGSQLCHPLTHQATGKVEYVITVAGNKANCLKQKHSELYEWILNHFAVRISMEHSLLIMKEKAHEPEQSAA